MNSLSVSGKNWVLKNYSEEKSAFLTKWALKRKKTYLSGIFLAPACP